MSMLGETVKDRKAWLDMVHGVPKSWTGLNNTTTTKGRDRKEVEVWGREGHNISIKGKPH